MRRILLISRCPPYPLHLGDRLIIWYLVRELRRRGYTFDLLAFAQQPADHDHITDYDHLFEQITLIDEPPRSQVSYITRLLWEPARFPQDAQASWSPPMWQAIQSQLAAHDYDLVHLFGGVQVYEFAALLEALPTLITPYESYSLYLSRQAAQQGGWMTHIQQRTAAAYERWMFEPYQRVVVVAQPDRDELLRLNPQLRVEVIPNGIDRNVFSSGKPVSERDAATLLFVGNYAYAPNLDAARYLIKEVLPAVREEIPDARLQLVGNAPPPELRAAANAHISVTGRVPDVRPYLAQATVFVCPLRLGAGIKNKVLEALAMGIPTAGTPISVDGIALEDGVHAVVAPPPQLAAATVRLLRDADMRRQLSQAGSALVHETYSWQHAADQYAALYRKLQRD